MVVIYIYSDYRGLAAKSERPYAKLIQFIKEPYLQGADFFISVSFINPSE